MVTNRRNFIFKVSIVINIAVLLYAAMHLSGNNPQGTEWVQVTGDGSERIAELRYPAREEYRNDSEMRIPESSSRILEESTSQKTPSTLPTTNKTASSTASTDDRIEKKSAKWQDNEADLTNETLDIVEEDALSETTLARLHALLNCHEKDFLPQYLQRGEYWVLKNYVRADHGMILCHESITYTTHAGFEFLDNVEPLVER